MKAVVLVTLVMAGTCLSTYTYPFNQNPQQTDMRPYIELKGLAANDVITFDLLFFKNTGYNPTMYYLLLANASLP